MGKELGTLVVVVLKAKNLHDRHSFYKQDPFAQITLNDTTHKTEPDVKGGQHPEWDAEFRFPIYQEQDEKHRTMEIICSRKEPRRDEEIGKGKLDISKTLKTGEFDDWIPIEDSAGVYRGEIYLEMTYFANGPAPLERRPSKLKPADRLSHLGQPQQPQDHGQYLKPPQSEAPLPQIPEYAESTKPVAMGPPNILRPGPRTSGGAGQPQGHLQETGRASHSQSPPRASPTLPASLAPGHSTSHQQHPQPRKSSNPYTEQPVHSPYHSPVPFAEASTPLSSTGPSQYTQIDYASSTNYHNEYQAPPVPNYGPPPRNDYTPHRASLNDYNPPPSQPEYSESSPAFFPTPQIVLAPVPSATPVQTYPNYPQAPPPQAPTPHFQPQQVYPPQYPISQPSIYPPPPNPAYRNPSPAPYQYHNYPPPPQSHNPVYGSPEAKDTELPDPHLIARYNSPLPLPPGQKKPAPASSSYRAPPRVPSLPVAENRSVLSPPPMPQVDPWEEERRREREQEEKDLALARKLDMELNM